MFAKIALSLALIFGLHLFHHHCHKQAKACGGCGQAVAVQSFAVAQPCYQQSFAVAAFQPMVYAQPLVVAQPVVVQQNVVRAQRTVVRQRTVIRSGF